MPRVYEIEAVEAMKTVAREMPRLVETLEEIREELRKLRGALEEAGLRRA